MENSQLVNDLGNLVNKIEEIKDPFFPNAYDYSTANELHKGIIKLVSITKAMYENAKIISTPIKIVENSFKIKDLNAEIQELQKSFVIEKDNYVKIIKDQKLELTTLKSKFNRFKRIVLFIILLSVLSILLWGFNYFLKWHWLSVHSKKVALYISFQILILFSLLRIITTNKAIKIIDIIIAVGIVILSII